MSILNPCHETKMMQSLLNDMLSFQARTGIPESPCLHRKQGVGTDIEKSVMQSEERPSRSDGVTYPADVAWEIFEGLGLQQLIHLKETMETEPYNIENRRDRLPTVEAFARSQPDSEIKRILRDRMRSKDVQSLIIKTCNNPCFLGLNVLEFAGLPSRGSSIFSSTATANSGNDDAVTSALQILGYCDESMGIKYTRTSTCTEDGRTGVSHVHPKNVPVFYNPFAPYDKWNIQAYNLAKQFYGISTGSDVSLEAARVVNLYDRIYHWGCISQNFQTSLLGHQVTSWYYHEEWNIIITYAMLWHGIMTLKTGGQMVVKFRIFKRAETLGLASLVASLFDKFDIFDNPRLVCKYVAVVYSGSTSDSDLRRQVAGLLMNAMDQKPENIFFNQIQVSNLKCRNAMLKCTQHRENVEFLSSKIHTLYLAGLYCVKQMMKTEDRNTTEKNLGLFRSELERLYGKDKWKKIYDRFVNVRQSMTPTQEESFSMVLNSDWMKENF